MASLAKRLAGIAAAAEATAAKTAAAIAAAATEKEAKEAKEAKAVAETQLATVLCCYRWPTGERDGQKLKQTIFDG